MFTRQEILDTLNQQQERMTKRYLTFTSEEVDRPCTASETPNASPWTPKDHLAHMTMIEQMFLDIVRRALAGNPDPIGLHRFGSMDSEGLTNWLYQKGPAVGAEQNNHGLKAFQDWLHRVNQDYVDAHHS
ncbi:MAG: hypothetical protein M3Z24_09585, partial [Chloroflexota bacterium]|nr:hypothetical protein [Chloroflexota bacterium]